MAYNNQRSGSDETLSAHSDFSSDPELLTATESRHTTCPLRGKSPSVKLMSRREKKKLARTNRLLQGDKYHVVCATALSDAVVANEMFLSWHVNACKWQCRPDSTNWILQLSKVRFIDFKSMHIKNQPRANVSLSYDSNAIWSNLPTTTLKFSSFELFNLLNAVVWFVFTLFSQDMARSYSGSFWKKYLDFDRA